MIYPGIAEESLLEDEKSKNFEKAVSDVCSILEQEGYGATAVIFKRMVKESNIRKE